MGEPTWFEDMATRVREVQRDEAGNLTTESYLHVCEGNLKIFTIIFNGYVTAPAMYGSTRPKQLVGRGWPRVAEALGSLRHDLALQAASGEPAGRSPHLTLTRYVTAEVGRQLAAANENGQSIVRKDAEKIGAAGKTLVSMVKHQVAETGHVKLGTPGETSGTKSLLWLNRELTFICKLIRLLISGREASEAGYEAYDTVIKPYHAWIVQKFVGNAVGYVPLTLAVAPNPNPNPNPNPDPSPNPGPHSDPKPTPKTRWATCRRSSSCCHCSASPHGRRASRCARASATLWSLSPPRCWRCSTRKARTHYTYSRTYCTCCTCCPCCTCHTCCTYCRTYHTDFAYYTCYTCYTHTYCTPDPSTLDATQARTSKGRHEP